jgi:SCY1-like protein 1
VQIHGNVCMAAVVVTGQLDWRLHGFDLLSEHAGGAELPLINASWMVGQQYKPGEVRTPPPLRAVQTPAHPHSAGAW